MQRTASVGSSNTSNTVDGDRRLWVTFWIFLAIGTFFTLANLRWPIARNALCYAKAALGIIEHHFNLFAVAHDRVWTSGKPIFFSALAAPFVWLLGANAGTIVASAVGTAFFLWTVTLALPRLNRLSGLDPNLMPLEFVLVTFNPLVLYQFWSGYPDSLFAGLVMLAFVLTDIIATEPERDTRWHIFSLGVTMYVAIHTKLYGAVLLVTCPLYLLMHARPLVSRSTHRTSKIGILVAVFTVLALVLVGAKFNINPLLDFAEGGGFSVYVGGIVDAKTRDIFDSLSMLGFGVLLIFQAALLLLATRGAWRAWVPAPTVFAAIYLLGLLTFPGTRGNMRYFLPALPFMVPALAAGRQSIRPAARRAILATYGAIAFVLVLSFNLAPIELIAQPLLSKLSARCAPLDVWLDNLRLPVHIALKRQIDTINREVPAGSVFYWSSSYYGTATHGLAEHLGVKKGLDIRYVLLPSGIRASPGPVFLTAFTSDAPTDKLWVVPDWAAVKNVGYGLFRLDPISIELESLSGDYVKEMNAVRLQAKVTFGDRLKVSSVEFTEGDAILGFDQQPPFELVWQAPTRGRHEIVARVWYGERDALVSESVIYVGIPAIERTAKKNTDLAVELGDGSVWPPYRGLRIAGEERAVGIRFEKVNVSKGAHIANSYLQLTAAYLESQPATLDIQGELSANAPPLKFDMGDLSQRHRTIESVNWVSKPWAIVGEQERSPNLNPILEEIFSLAGWQPGNAIVLFIHCSGQRVAQLANENGVGAPRLYIELQRK